MCRTRLAPISRLLVLAPAQKSCILDKTFHELARGPLPAQLYFTSLITDKRCDTKLQETVRQPSSTILTHPLPFRLYDTAASYIF